VGEQDGGADPLVSAAGRVGAVNPGQDWNSILIEFRMTEKSGTGSTTTGVKFFLFG